jgi:hypothetical protein
MQQYQALFGQFGPQGFAPPGSFGTLFDASTVWDALDKRAKKKAVTEANWICFQRNPTCGTSDFLGTFSLVDFQMSADSFDGGPGGVIFWVKWRFKGTCVKP